MRFFAFFLAIAAAAFAYKDTFYIGGYGGGFDGTIERGSADIDLEHDKVFAGFRLGWNNNMRVDWLAKIRWEIYYENRSYDLGGSNAKKTADGYHAGASVALGYNLDWLLTQEIVPYFKIGMGLGAFGDDFNDGSNLNLGVGLAFSTRYFELTCEARREFWQMKGFRFAFQTPFVNDGSIDVVAAGINFRF